MHSKLPEGCLAFDKFWLNEFSIFILVTLEICDLKIILAFTLKYTVTKVFVIELFIDSLGHLLRFIEVWHLADGLLSTHNSYLYSKDISM